MPYRTPEGEPVLATVPRKPMSRWMVGRLTQWIGCGIGVLGATILSAAFGPPWGSSLLLYALGTPVFWAVTCVQGFNRTMRMRRAQLRRSEGRLARARWLLVDKRLEAAMGLYGMWVPHWTPLPVQPGTKRE